MTRLASAYAGEDVPITLTYEDDAGNAVDPDDPTTEPTVTIVDTSDESEIVSSVLMDQNATGEFEYVWDTTGESTGTYQIAVSADFNAETKIVKQELQLR